MENWIKKDFEEMVRRDFADTESPHAQRFFNDFNAQEYLSVNDLEDLVSQEEIQEIFEALKKELEC